MIYLKKMSFYSTCSDKNYPLNIPLFKEGFEIEFHRNVTIVVGENGTGKSTILKYLADNIGFSLNGGNINNSYNGYGTISKIEGFKLTWNIKTRKGFFFRSDTFDEFYKYIENNRDILQFYNGKFSELSHGQAFLKLFKRFNSGLFLLDEPESALSPQNQLALMRLIYDLEKDDKSQFIILTHSPILMMYPNAEIYQILDEKIESINYKDTPHYAITKMLLNEPDRVFHNLFSDD